MLKYRNFYHQNIRYSFNWNLNHHKDKIKIINSNRQEFIRLGTYFKKIYSGNIPNNLFNTKSIPRASQFKLKGVKRSFLSSFSKKLMRDGKINNSNSKLSNFAQNVFENYKKNQINKKPGHNPILKNILIKDKNSIAIEVPIWRKINNKYITGHIDLIQIEDGIVKIVDYKPEGNFMLSLPQVATYGLLMKSLFNLSNLKCVSFNKKQLWEYDPNILLTDIKEYLISQQIKDRVWENYVSI
ncbi:MAG: hypothetical protein ACTSRI_02900 [Promethearchaeota archaeon]